MTRTTRRAAAIVLGLIAALVLPAVAFAHPLGNFTINHYAGIQVETDRILLDVVIDQAEIPTFQARLTLDTDGDGELSDAETEAARIAACGELAPSLTLSQGGTRLQLEATDAGLEFPAGVGGLSTMRTVCEFRATLPSAITAASTSFAFEDRSFPDRIGWREIVVVGSGAAVTASRGSKLRTEGVSNRLTHYPANLADAVPCRCPRRVQRDAGRHGSRSVHGSGCSAFARAPGCDRRRGRDGGAGPTRRDDANSRGQTGIRRGHRRLDRVSGDGWLHSRRRYER